MFLSEREKRYLMTMVFKAMEADPDQERGLNPGDPCNAWSSDCKGHFQLCVTPGEMRCDECGLWTRMFV